jgi:hypothetical protein
MRSPAERSPKVVIDVSGEPFMDIAREAAALFARQ